MTDNLSRAVQVMHSGRSALDCYAICRRVPQRRLFDAYLTVVKERMTWQQAVAECDSLPADHLVCLMAGYGMCAKQTRKTSRKERERAAGPVLKPRAKRQPPPPEVQRARDLKNRPGRVVGTGPVAERKKALMARRVKPPMEKPN